MRLSPLLCQRAIKLDAGVVESQLDDGNVRAGRLREIAKLQLIELQLSGVELIEAVAEMQQQQIGLVSEQRVERALALLLRGSESRGKFLRDLLSLAGVQTFPLAPANAEHLMQNGRAFHRQGHGVQFLRQSFGRSGGHDA